VNEDAQLDTSQSAPENHGQETGGEKERREEVEGDFTSGTEASY
jgi:hypothetical protein